MGLLRDFRYEISALVLGLGILGTVLSLTYYFFRSQVPDWLRSLASSLGDYNFWTGALGLLAVLGGGYYFVDTIRKEREFDRLLSTASKEVFVKNMKRIEELVYYHLPSSYEKRFREKRQEFRIKS